MISKMEISSSKDYLETNEESEPRIAKGFLEDVISMFEEIQQYRAIGTVEECREARKRQSTKKVKNRKLLRDFHNRPYSVRGDCPNCGREGLLSTNTDYCNVCGQKLDWSDTP